MERPSQHLLLVERRPSLVTMIGCHSCVIQWRGRTPKQPEPLLLLRLGLNRPLQVLMAANQPSKIQVWPATLKVSSRKPKVDLISTRVKLFKQWEE
jgi:hypothetical protein